MEPAPPPAVETTWLEQIIHIGKNDTPQGPILLITLANGHRYAIPCYNGPIRDAIYKIASPFTVASQMPVNGSGTRPSGQ